MEVCPSDAVYKRSPVLLYNRPVKANNHGTVEQCSVLISEVVKCGLFIRGSLFGDVLISYITGLISPAVLYL